VQDEFVPQSGSMADFIERAIYSEKAAAHIGKNSSHRMAHSGVYYAELNQWVQICRRILRVDAARSRFPAHSSLRISGRKVRLEG
jgi:hypothetical protein